MAIDLLGCYVSTFDEIVRNISEDFARARQKDQIALGQPTRIEVDDVQKAAEFFTKAIREKLGNDPKHAELIKAVEGMHECLKKRCQMPEGAKAR